MEAQVRGFERVKIIGVNVTINLKAHGPKQIVKIRVIQFHHMGILVFEPEEIEEDLKNSGVAPESLLRNCDDQSAVIPQDACDVFHEPFPFHDVLQNVRDDNDIEGVIVKEPVIDFIEFQMLVPLPGTLQRIGIYVCPAYRIMWKSSANHIGEVACIAAVIKDPFALLILKQAKHIVQLRPSVGP